MTKKILAAAAAICLLFPAIAQKPGKPMPTAEPVKTGLNYEYALNDPLNARIYTLKNGMKVYLSVYKDAPRIQTYIAVKAGSKNDPANATGLAHYLEHMVFKGTDVYGTKDAKKELAEIKKIENLFESYRNTTNEEKRRQIYHQIDSISGVAARYAIANEYDKMLASIGADKTNAFTSFDQTVYVNDIPSNQISNWLKIEAERFRNPILRLFHTELEAVYEEKNRSLDSDPNKVWEAMLNGLFKNHTYGTQTTIGTIDHLKNPSMTEINKYYKKYYVPNNMAIIMSGDFDPAKVIVEIEKTFGNVPAKPVPTYTFQPETPRTHKVSKDVFGPDPANINLAWSTAGEGSKDADICTMISGLLYNGTAGLIDINLNQAQKVLASDCYFYTMKDYGLFSLSGQPKEGQTLEQVEELLLDQLNVIRKGEFPDWLMQAVVTDLKLRKTRELESNDSRAQVMLNAFVNDVKWQSSVNQLERISKLSKQEIVDYANTHLNQNNYVVVYKRTGEDNSVPKVDKPAITPVEPDREHASPFVENITKSAPPAIEPRFIDYDKDIQKATLKSNVPLLYNKNTENRLFSLYYKFDMGSNNDKMMPVAVKYIPYLSLADMGAAKVKEEFYRLGCSFNVFCNSESIWVSLSGLSDNYDEALKLFEKLLANPVVEEEVLKNMISDIIKEREDNKLQKGIILNRGMVSYARYGPINPFSYVLTNDELNKITTVELKNKIKGLLSFEHKVLYYGPRDISEVQTSLNAHHNVPAKLNPVPPAYKFEERQMDKTVYVVDYDMKQAEIIMLSSGINYDPKQVPLIYIYNAYFGGSMSSVVFQDLRESKALAYSTFSEYNQPNKLSKKYLNVSYIGSQADKLGEAMSGLNALLNEMPKSEVAYNSAKESILQEMRTQRVTKGDILFNYLAAQDLNNTYDIRKDIFEKVQGYTYDDIKKFQEQNIKGKPITVLVLGKKANLDMKVLENYGTVKVLSLSEIFGY